MVCVMSLKNCCKCVVQASQLYKTVGIHTFSCSIWSTTFSALWDVKKTRLLKHCMLFCHYSVVALTYMSLQRTHARRSDRKGASLPTALAALRQTNTALQEGTKRMYELLHETEHRILTVQAGGSYMEHVKACKVCILHGYYIHISNISYDKQREYNSMKRIGKTLISETGFVHFWQRSRNSNRFQIHWYDRVMSSLNIMWANSIASAIAFVALLTC